MNEFKSLLDPNHKYYVDESEWVVSIVRFQNDKEHVFLMLEGVNQFGKYVLTRYDCRPDCRVEDKYIINIDQRIVDPSQRNIAYLELIQHQNIFCKAWPITKIDAFTLNDNIFNLSNEPRKYNPLGDVAFFPKMVGFTGGLSEDQKKWLKETTGTAALAGISTAAMCLGPKMAFNVSSVFSITCGLANVLKEGMTGVTYDCIETSCGRPARNFVKASLSKSGDNSYTWARHLLYGINNQHIIRDLPKKPLDFIKSSATKDWVLVDIEDKEEQATTSLNLSI